MVPMEGEALTAVQGVITSLTSDVTTLIPIALGAAILPFAAKWLFKKAKGLMGG